MDEYVLAMTRGYAQPKRYGGAGEENDEYFIKTEELCIQNDEFCRCGRGMAAWQMGGADMDA